MCILRREEECRRNIGDTRTVSYYNIHTTSLAVHFSRAIRTMLTTCWVERLCNELKRALGDAIDQPVGLQSLASSLPRRSASSYLIAWEYAWCLLCLIFLLILLIVLLSRFSPLLRFGFAQARRAHRQVVLDN